MIGMLILSHSNLIAKGLVETCKQMAPDINIEGIGGIEKRLGIDAELALQKLNEMLENNEKVVIYADIGSTVLSAKTIKELSSRPADVHIVDAPLVEGSITGSIEISIGSDIDKIIEESKKSCFIEKN
jgi:PTS hybrid protein|uniref:PTS mannose transporter subunit IID n=1 Tax=Desulfurella acetivorans TaxID=33002 RepID=A0A832ENN1_DESAE